MIAIDDHAFAFDHVDFVLVVVKMLRRVAARLDLELPHCKRWSFVAFADQPTHLAAGGPFHRDFVRGNLIELFDLHV